MFIERIRAIGLRNLLALSALLAAGVLVFTNPAGADDPDFAPTITLQTSTTRAAAHPDARITVDNSNSNEQIKDLTIDLPDGFMGSLNAAQQCSRTDAANESCPAASQIGTVVNYARVDNSDVVLRGKVYLTEALDNGEPSGVTGPSANPRYWEPAGMQIVVPGKIGGVDVGNVVVNARIDIRYGPTWTGAPAGAKGAVKGVRTIVKDVPRSITDSHGRTVNFSLTKMVVDLKSDQSSPYSPLLTNPSDCLASGGISADFGSWPDQSDVVHTASDDDSYTVSQCDDVFVPDAQMTFNPTTHQAGNPLAFSTTVTMADDAPPSFSLDLQLPPSLAANFPSFGSAADQCPVTSFDQANMNAFTTKNCPSQAKVGTVEIKTPLLADPVEGELWLIEKSPIPYLGIYADSTTGTNNPKGMTVGLVGNTNGTTNLNSTCLLGVSCMYGMSISFSNIPDIQVSSIKVDASGAPRPRGGGNPDLAPEILTFATAADPSCRPQADIAATINAWVDSNVTRRSSAITSTALNGCTTPPAARIEGAPFGTFTTVNPATLSFQTDAVNTTGKCDVDYQGPRPRSADRAMETCNPVINQGDPSTATGTYPGATALDQGVHYFYASVAGNVNYRAFAVPVEPPADTTAPVVTITDDPGATTADTTPSIEFTSDEDAFFQCALDDGPFLPCDSSVSTVAQAGTYTVTTALIPGDDVHTISVRPVDLGNNAGVVKTFSFKVEVPLDPTFDVDVSTSAARAHPTLDMTVTSGSHEDIKNLTLAMPNGFLGSLNGAATLCPVATATSGACTDASKVGTVDTEAIVDESTVRISGNVYMTEPIALGDPAGLVIDVHAKIQDVDDGHVIVPVRMVVRGEAQGIDSVATNLPTAIDPAAWGNSWDGPSEFDLRSITLKLRNNPGASQPLLTNPSDCGASSFAATFVGENSTTVSKSEPFQATDCGALSFAPNLSLKMVDSATGKVPGASTLTKRVNVDFTAEMATSPDGSALKNAVLTLPKPLTIDVGHLPYPCQPAEQQAKNCPASSAIGTASATSPLLREPLTGTVYVLKSETSLPRMLIAMRGRINLDIIADNSFVNVNQIVTTFSSVPDAPLSNFTMNVQKFLMTRDWTCTETKPADWNVLGTLGAYSGASAPVNIPLKFDCPSAGAKPSVKVRFSGSGRKFTARVYATAPSGKRITKATVSLPKGVRLKRSVYRKASAMHRYVPVLVDHRPLRVQCYGKRSATSFEVDTRKKSAKRIKVRFKRGALVVSKKFTRKHPPKFKVKVTLKSDAGKTSTATVSARVYYRGLRAANRRKLVARTSVKPC